MVGRLVWEHPWPCRPTAASSKHESEAPASGPSVRPAGNGPPSCSPRAAPRPRSPASSTYPASALEGIEQALLEGAQAHGFATDVWTLDRIAVVIQGLTGVALSNPSVWRLLRNRLGWMVQRPEGQAKERDEQAIQHWVAHQWPRINKGQPQNRPGLSSSTNRAAR
jgi:hypothetical protein